MNKVYSLITREALRKRRPLGSGIVVSQHCIVCRQIFTYLFPALVWKTKWVELSWVSLRVLLVHSDKLNSTQPVELSLSLWTRPKSQCHQYFSLKEMPRKNRLKGSDVILESRLLCELEHLVIASWTVPWYWFWIRNFKNVLSRRTQWTRTKWTQLRHCWKAKQRSKPSRNWYHLKPGRRPSIQFKWLFGWNLSVWCFELRWTVFSSSRPGSCSRLVADKRTTMRWRMRNKGIPFVRSIVGRDDWISFEVWSTGDDWLHVPRACRM